MEPSLSPNNQQLNNNMSNNDKITKLELELRQEYLLNANAFRSWSNSEDRIKQIKKELLSLLLDAAQKGEL